MIKTFLENLIFDFIKDVHTWLKLDFSTTGCRYQKISVTYTLLDVTCHKHLSLWLYSFQGVFMSDSIPLASHLLTPRSAYTHHGLYAGNGQVIHFTSNGKVEEIALSKFTHQRGYRIRKFYSRFNPKQIIERAKSRLGKRNYSVLFNNCEHFVTWCIYGEAESKQVQDAIALSTTITGMVTRNVITPTVAFTPISTAAIMGYGFYKLVQFLKD